MTNGDFRGGSDFSERRIESLKNAGLKPPDGSISTSPIRPAFGVALPISLNVASSVPLNPL